MPPPIAPVRMVDDFGDVHDVHPDEVAGRQDAGWSIETPDAAAARVGGAAAADSYSGIGETIDAYAAAVPRGFTGGMSDAAIAAVGGDSTRRYLKSVKEANPGISAVGEAVGNVTGAVTGTGPIGRASALATRLAEKEGAGAIARVGRSALGGALEGGVAEVGSGVSDLALADDPVSVDRIASSLSSRFFYGGLTGGVAGGGLKGLEVGLTGARRRLAAAKEGLAKGDAVPDDLVALDRKGLRAAHDAELAAIETARLPQRELLAGDVATFRESSKNAKPWLAVATGQKAKGVSKTEADGLAKAAADAEAEAIHWEARAASSKSAADLEAATAARAEATAAADAVTAASAPKAEAPRWMREQGKLFIESDKLLDRVLRNPKRLAESPQVAKAALQQQEAAIEKILARTDELKVLHATDTTGQRAAALDELPKVLEQNRALQRRIMDLTATPASQRLVAITDAIDSLSTAKSRTLGEQMAGGAAYGMVADVVRSIPFVGPLAAPLIAARVADSISGKLGGQLAAATRAATERATKAVDAFLNVTQKAQRVAPVLASKVLDQARFALEPSTRKERTKKPSLEESYDERVAEISSAVEPDPAVPGRLKVRANVRAQIADRLSPIATVAPHVADRLETHAVKRLELIARTMPKTTRLGMTKVRPTEMAIRAWARYIAAADDPGAIEERLADGSVTPEDAEVMRELYPDRMAEITRQIVEKIETLQTLPYHRRIALSIFTGAPVDAAMEPAILAALQAQFDQEEGTEGGVQAPRPQPAFGSVKKSVPAPTPAQERAG